MNTSTEKTTDTAVHLSEATRRFQQKHIRASINKSGGDMEKAAHRLGLHHSNLFRKMRQLGMALLLTASLASQANAGWFAEMTFAPQPYFGGSSMVWRGGWAPSYNRSPYNRSSHRGGFHRGW